MRALVELVVVISGGLGIFKFCWSNRPSVLRERRIRRLREENDALDDIIDERK